MSFGTVLATIGSLSAVVSVLSGCGGSGGSTLPVGESQVTVDGRRVVLHNPGLAGSLPLVVGLHEWTGSATGEWSFCSSGKIAELSSSLGFIGVCPDGYLPDQGASWNAAGCCGNAVDDNVDDVQFLRNVVSRLKSLASISEVYAMGLSNGGMMSFRLACEAHDVFDGVAPFAGAWFGEPPFTVIGSHPVPDGWHTSTLACSNETAGLDAVSCASCYDHASYPSDQHCWKHSAYSCTAPPAKYPVMYTHGEADDNEPYAIGVANFKHYAQEVLGCAGLAASPNYVEGKAKCFEYASCPEERRVALCSVEGLGHEMPGENEMFDGVRTAWSWIHGGWPSLIATAI